MSMFDRIKYLSKKRDKNLKSIAIELGYGENYFYSIKSGKSPSAEKLQEIADYFNVSTDYLLGRSEDPHAIQDMPKELTVEEALASVMSSNGKPLTDNDRKILTGIIEAYIENTKNAE